MKKLIAAILLGTSLSFAGPPLFFQLKVGWDPSPDMNVASYNIYYGTNLVDLLPYVLLTNVPGRLNTNATVNIPAMQNGFLVATAVATGVPYNPTNYTFLESDFSNPVFLTATKAGSNFRIRP